MGGAQASGSHYAIVLGIVLDGIPESMVIGLGLLHGGAVSAAVIVAVFLSNLPEAIAATSGLLTAGWRRGRILGLWVARRARHRARVARRLRAVRRRVRRDASPSCSRSRAARC